MRRRAGGQPARLGSSPMSSTRSATESTIREGRNGKVGVAEGLAARCWSRDPWPARRVLWPACAGWWAGVGRRSRPWPHRPAGGSRTGPPPQPLEGGLRVQMLAADDYAFGLLDQPPVLQGGLELVGQPALGLGGRTRRLQTDLACSRRCLVGPVRSLQVRSGALSSGCARVAPSDARWNVCETALGSVMIRAVTGGGGRDSWND